MPSGRLSRRASSARADRKRVLRRGRWGPGTETCELLWLSGRNRTLEQKPAQRFAQRLGAHRLRDVDIATEPPGSVDIAGAIGRRQHDHPHIAKLLVRLQL